MFASIHIDRLHNLYRVSRGGEDPAAVRERLDALVTSRVTEALERALPDVLAKLGLGPAAEVAIAKLDVRLRLRGADIPEDRIAEAWTRAVANAAGRALEPLLPSGGATSTVAVFHTRFDAELESLRDLSMGLPAPWWAGRLLHEPDGRVPEVATILDRWIDRCPERVAPTLASLFENASLGLDRLVSEEQARHLFKRLWTLREDRRRDLREGIAGSPAVRHLPEPLVAPHARPFVKSGPQDLRELRRLLSSEQLRAAERTRAPFARRFMLACLALARRPSLSRRDVETLALLLEQDVESEQASFAPPKAPPSRPEDPSAPLDRPQPPAAPPPEHLSPADAERSSKTAHPSPEPPSNEEPPRNDLSPHPSPTLAPRDQPPSPRARLSDQPEADPAGIESPLGEHATCAGGLLFLARRLARSSWLDDHSGPALESRLVAFAQAVLLRAFGALSEAHMRAAAILRERPLIAAFSGSRTLPDTLAALPDDEATRDARKLADEIATELPLDLPPFEDGIRTVYGSERAPFPGAHPHRTLAHLVLRPGRLVLTEHRADLFLPMRAVDVALRSAGWDIDPGFLPHIGRVIRFHYEQTR